MFQLEEEDILNKPISQVKISEVPPEIRDKLLVKYPHLRAEFDKYPYKPKVSTVSKEDEHPWTVTYNEPKETGWLKQFMDNLATQTEPIGHFVFNLPERLVELDKEISEQYKAKARGEEPPSTPYLDEINRLIKETIPTIAQMGKESGMTFFAPWYRAVKPEAFPITEQIQKQYVVEPAKELIERSKEKLAGAEGVKEHAMAVPSAAFGMLADYAKENPLDAILWATILSGASKKFAKTALGKAMGMSGEASKWEKFISPKLKGLSEKLAVKTGESGLARKIMPKTSRKLRLITEEPYQMARLQQRITRATGKVDMRKVISILDDKSLIDADKEFLGTYMRAKGNAGIPITKLEALPENQEILRGIAKELQTTTNPAAKTRLRKLLKELPSATSVSDYGDRIKISRDIVNKWYGETMKRGIALDPTRAATVTEILDSPPFYKLTNFQHKKLIERKNALSAIIEKLDKPQLRITPKQLQALEEHDELADFVKQLRTHGNLFKGDLVVSAEKIKKIAQKKLLGLSKEERTLAKSKLYLKTRFPGKANYQRKLKETIQKIDDKLFAHIHQAGSEDYMRRMYRVYLEDEGKYKYFTAEEIARKPKIKALYAKQRLSERELPRQIRKEVLGEVTQPAFPTAHAIGEMKEDVAVFDLYDDVMRNYGSDVPLSGYSEKPFKFESRRWYKEFKGKYLPQDIYDDLMDIQKIHSRASEIARKYVSFFKTMKVPYNIATQIRNAVCNMILADIAGGVSPFRDAQFYDDALKQMMDKSDEYLNFQKMGVSETTFIDAELKFFRQNYLASTGTPYERLLETFKKIARTPGSLYAKSEEYFKFVVYLKQRSLGLSELESARAAQKALFDYTDVPPVIDWMRKSPFGAPFVTFTWKALPLTGEMLIKRPLRVLKWVMITPLITEYTAERLNISKKKLNQIKAFLPDWVQPGTSAFVGQDEEGRYEWLETGWYMPWGNIMENPQWAKNLPILKHLPAALSPGQNPIFQSLMTLVTGRDSYTGENIADETVDNEMTQLRKRTMHILKQQGPPLAGGHAYETLKKGITEEKDYRGRVKYTVPEAIERSILGIKKTKVDVKEQKQFAYRKLMQQRKEIMGEMHRVQRDHNLTTEEKREKIRKLRERYTQLTQEFKNKMQGEND